MMAAWVGLSRVGAKLRNLQLYIYIYGSSPSEKCALAAPAIFATQCDYTPTFMIFLGPMTTARAPRLLWLSFAIISHFVLSAAQDQGR